jgi:hypothetical protein
VIEKDFDVPFIADLALREKPNAAGAPRLQGPAGVAGRSSERNIAA